MGTKNHLFVLQREVAGTPFEGEVDGKPLTLAHINDVDQFALADLLADDSVSDLRFMTAVLRLAADEENFALISKARLSRPEVVALFEAYKAHNGADEGESEASSD